MICIDFIADGYSLDTINNALETKFSQEEFDADVFRLIEALERVSTHPPVPSDNPEHRHRLLAWRSELSNLYTTGSNNRGQRRSLDDVAVISSAFDEAKPAQLDIPTADILHITQTEFPCQRSYDAEQASPTPKRARLEEMRADPLLSGQRDTFPAFYDAQNTSNETDENGAPVMDLDQVVEDVDLENVELFDFNFEESPAGVLGFSFFN